MRQIPQGMISVSEILAYLNQDRYMPKPEAAQYLGISVSNLEKHLRVMPYYRLGSKVLLKKSELDRWMEQYKEMPADNDLNRLADEAVQAVLGPRK